MTGDPMTEVMATVGLPVAAASGNRDDDDEGVQSAVARLRTPVSQLAVSSGATIGSRVAASTLSRRALAFVSSPSIAPM
jgi:hypothetical protein